jgi:uncharacterized protein (DUF736 family)
METNMIIGRFEYDKASDTFSGSIFTLHFQIGDVQFVPADKKSDNGPQYRLVSERAHASKNALKQVRPRNGLLNPRG